MRVLVTGGAGFIGSNFVNYCVSKDPDIEIDVLDSLTYAANIRNLPANDRVHFWYGDIRFSNFLIKELLAKTDVVVHFAAESAVARSVLDNKVFVDTEVAGTLNLAELALRSKIKKFIHISSSEVYGTSVDNERMDENHPLNPCSPYAAAKSGADRIIYSYWATYGFPAIIVRPFNNYGPHQHLEKVVPKFIVSSIIGEPMTIAGNGKAERDWIYVEDNCDAIYTIMTNGQSKDFGHAFNVGTGQSMSVEAIAMSLQMILGSRGIKTKAINVDDRPGQVRKHLACSTKMMSRFGWRSKVTIPMGLGKTVDWYMNNRDKWEHQLPLMHTCVFEDGGKKVCY